MPLTCRLLSCSCCWWCAASAMGEGWKPHDVVKELQRLQAAGELTFSASNSPHHHLTLLPPRASPLEPGASGAEGGEAATDGATAGLASEAEAAEPPPPLLSLERVDSLVEQLVALMTTIEEAR